MKWECDAPPKKKRSRDGVSSLQRQPFSPITQLPSPKSHHIDGEESRWNKACERIAQDNETLFIFAVAVVIVHPFLAGSVDCWCTRSTATVRRGLNGLLKLNNTDAGRPVATGGSETGERAKNKNSIEVKTIFIVHILSATHIAHIGESIFRTEEEPMPHGVEEKFYCSSYPMILKSWQQVEVKWEKRRKTKYEEEMKGERGREGASPICRRHCRLRHSFLLSFFYDRTIRVCFWMCWTETSFEANTIAQARVSHAGAHMWIVRTHTQCDGLAQRFYSIIFTHVKQTHNTRGGH